ncbi:hypothetical protein PoB_001060800 [Plakobranchus ocellatus]|uniref:Uncharacterized protein n=1 Tax=Plakobranchus ocellatus TaxID=259542 RepID=A0AAV3YP31_9GAST|nr:hypothetical protein PoB_001060800 [Plakobranchus ocellatus]
MFLFIVITFVLAVDTVSCADCSRDCQAEKWDNAPRSKPSEICKAGREWRACLDKLLTQGCDVMSRYTQDLNSADRSCDEKDPVDAKPSSDCSAMADCSTNDEIEATSKPSKKCALAKKWRSCLVTFMNSCTVEFPFDLNKAEAMNCFLPDDDDDDDADKDGDDDDADKDGDDDDDSAGGSDSGKTTKTDDDKTGGSDSGNTTKSDDSKASGSGGDDNTGGADDDKDDDDEDEDECETSFEACDANKAKVDSAQGDLNKCVYVLGWKSCYTSVVRGKGCPADKDRDEKVAELESTYCGVRRN